MSGKTDAEEALIKACLQRCVEGDDNILRELSEAVAKERLDPRCVDFLIQYDEACQVARRNWSLGVEAARKQWGDGPTTMAVSEVQRRRRAAR